LTFTDLTVLLGLELAETAAIEAITTILNRRRAADTARASLRTPEQRRRIRPDARHMRPAWRRVQPR
jgi:hypothetical protein